MDRLTLYPRPKTTEREKCLPAGDGLPAWESLPLYSKFPMVPIPKGSIKLCTTKLCEPKHKVVDFEFDLTDPYCHVISNEYQPLHDPHLKNHFNIPRMQRHLRKNGFITDDRQVICNLREFNQYRQYLRKICLLEMAKERKEMEGVRRLRGMSGGEHPERSESRGEQVRRRLQQMREETKTRIQREIREKEARLKRRLEEIELQKRLREFRRRQILQKRRAMAAEHLDKTMRKNLMLTRRWKQREKLRKLRLEERKRNKLLTDQKKITEMWNTRKEEQIRRMAAENEIRMMEDKRREKSMEARDRKFSHQRDKLRVNLEEIQRQSREERERRERGHKARLSRRLALVKLKMANRRRGRRYGSRYESLWALEDILREISMSDLWFTGKQSTGQFLQMINEALDIEIKKLGEDAPGYTNEREINRKAREIVDSVLHKVKTDVYPAYLQMRSDEQKGKVKFGKDDAIPPNREVDRAILRPVSEHVLTPIPSPFLVKRFAMTEKSSEMKLVENLLNRLLDDLNRGRLTEEEVSQLSRYAMDIVSCRLHAEESEWIADDVVEFTLNKVRHDIKTGAVPHEEVTEMAAILVGRKRDDSFSDISISSDDEQLQKYIDDTIESIVKDPDLGRDSPIHDAMLDEWIINTLKEITDDINQGRLSKSMVAEMVSMMTREDVERNDIQTLALRPFFEKVIDDLEGGESTSLYKVVHAVVSSYHAYKVGILESYTELISLITERFRQAIEKGVKESETDFNKLQEAALRLTSAALSNVKMSEIVTNITDVFKELGSETTESDLTIETMIENAKHFVMQSDFSTLKRIANAMTAALQNLPAVKRRDEKTFEADQALLRNVTNLVIRVLKIVGNSLERDGFTAEDVQDMTKIFSTMVRENISPTESDSKEEMLTRHISEMLRIFESGCLDEKELFELGSSLIHCGNRLLQGKEPFDSPNVTSKPSLTSSAVASDVLTHILFSIQDELHKSLITKEAIKELALCILKTRISKDYYTTTAQNLSTRESPTISDTKIEFAKNTLKEMLSDFKLGDAGEYDISSVAWSVVSLFSGTLSDEHKEKVEKMSEKVLQLLQEDSLTKNDVKRVFSTVLQCYSFAADDEIQTSSDLETIDSHLAYNLVKETIGKIERDIVSGRLSSKDILSVVDDSREKDIFNLKSHCDVVNLTLAIMQQFLLDLNSKNTTKDFINQFLSSAFGLDISPEETVPMIRIRIRKIMRDIRQKRQNSQHIQNLVHAFSSKAFLEESKLSKNKAVDLLQCAVQNVHPSIMTDFIRLTIQTLINDCIEYHEEEIESVQQEYILQSASSTIANKVVDNLLQRIGSLLRTDGDIKSTEHLISDDVVLSRTDLSSVPSEEMNALILDTLNNIISNLRLENSLELEDEILLRQASSQIIHDFVLEKLQQIVESMQDRLEDINQQKVSPESPLHTSPILIDDMEAKRVISESLKAVISDLTTEMERSKTKSAEKSTSTVSLEAEAIVVETLHGIINFCEEKGATMSENDAKMKENLLFILKSFKDDMYTNTAVHNALQNIFQSVITSSENESKNDEQLESALDVIIENIKTGSIHVVDVFTKSDMSSIGMKKGSTSSVNEVKERPSLSLQKMTDMTKEITNLYENVHPSRGKLDKESDCDIADQVTSEVKVFATEVLEKTIDNIQHEQLSKEELHTLASAIGDNEDTPITQLRLMESSIEEMIVQVLKNAVEDLRISGIDPEDLPTVTKSIFQVNVNKGAVTGSSITNASASPSEVITGMVTTVLSKIATNLSEESIKFTKIQNIQEGIQHSDSEKSGLEKERLSQDNVNPNAAKQCSVHSLLDNVGPQKRTTPTPTVHSAHDIKNKERRHRKSQSKERSLGYLPNKEMSKPKTPSKYGQGQKKTTKAYRPPMVKEIKASSKKDGCAITPKGTNQKGSKINDVASKNRHFYESQYKTMAEEQRGRNQSNVITDKDLPRQVYSLWGSFKLAVKSVNNDSMK
ncbi:uncharacterized protein LOC133186789 [Saccostrea echinata]|uniref:uncharacterized protein LOC133186789 n=1 Tax=Saccostrea echinata TaxID=191078 RepID=UPI002A80E04B|nr:uncharacterized protein LOC133186789 [Saccostrea echinata]